MEQPFTDTELRQLVKTLARVERLGFDADHRPAAMNYNYLMNPLLASEDNLLISNDELRLRIYKEVKARFADAMDLYRESGVCQLTNAVGWDYKHSVTRGRVGTALSLAIISFMPPTTLPLSALVFASFGMTDSKF